MTFGEHSLDFCYLVECALDMSLLLQGVRCFLRLFGKIDTSFPMSGNNCWVLLHAATNQLCMISAYHEKKIGPFFAFCPSRVCLSLHLMEGSVSPRPLPAGQRGVV